MGRLNNGAEHGLQVSHFSHPHLLELSILPDGIRSMCSGCNISILPGRGYYACRTCGFCLHSTCYKLPRKISHPADPNHHLILVLSSSFQCKACANPGTGFCYNCKDCSLNYHSLCTLKPLSMTHSAHSHPLMLEFKPPYGGQGFRCDLCRNPGLDQWFYSCSACGFDVHLDCPISKAEAGPTNNGFTETTRSVMDTSHQYPGGDYQNGSHQNITGYGAPAAYVTNRAVPVVSRGTQVMPQSGLASQGSNFPNGNQVYGNNIYPTDSYASNRMMMLQPTNGVPLVTLARANGAAGYGAPATMVPSQSQGSRNGMGGLFAGAVVSGIGQQLGQGLVGSLTSGFGGGFGSSDGGDGGISDIVGCWVGGSGF